jgi:sarcosine oxidase subunit beta
MSLTSVVIIGGGSTSALAAVRLAEQGFRVTVLEKAAIGNGSSSRSAAGIRAQFGVEETVIGMRYSEWWYAHFHDHLHTPVEQRGQPVIRQNGYLFLYEDPAQAGADDPAFGQRCAYAWERAQTHAAMQRRLGVPVEVLTPAEIGRRWPHLDADRLIGATWCAEDGFLVPDMIYTQGFRRARELGVEVREQTEVLGASVAGGRIVSLQTTRGPVEADLFVNATNAWAPRVSQRLGGMALAISPTRRYLYFWKPDPPALEPERWQRLPMTIYGLRGAHSRPQGDLLLLAWVRETPPEPDFADADQDAIRPGFLHKEGIENFGYAVLEQAALFSPRLVEEGGLVATTSGFYGMTPDANPLIGFDAHLSNLLHAAGFSGHGLMHAPVTAVLVEALLSERVTNGYAALPPPFDQYSINLATFNPGRDFHHSLKEAHVL